MDKKEYYEERREAISYLRPRWRKCFWTWPWGHRYKSVRNGVRCCSFCQKPEFMDKASTSDIIDLGM
jgi:hypothetical protein